MADTLVFVDLEGTGLNEPRRITQIALLACSIDDFKSSANGIPANAKTYCRMINPTVPLQQSAKDVTGFTDEQLIQYPTFAELFHEIQDFFALLPQPIYLVAHGGGRFDFPVLRNEVLRTGHKLGVNFILVDTFPIFKAYGQSQGGGRAGWTYGLRAIYKKFYHVNPPQNHDAMEDVRMLAMCCKKITNSFLLSAYRNTVYTQAW